MKVQCGLYPCPMINIGKLLPINDIIHLRFNSVHRWKLYHKDVLHQDTFNDITTIRELRTRDMEAWEKKYLKNTLQCWQPSCCMTDKTKGKTPQHLNPILCLDFDHLEEWDIESLKHAIFDLPFVGCVSLSCSGKGVYALIPIDEPERLKAYAEQCFTTFENYRIPIDKSKGQNPTQLRFVSYDENLMVREYPTKLKIKRFNAPKPKVRHYTAPIVSKSTGGLIKWACEQISTAQVGNRWHTVQRVAYTMGGHGIGLDEIRQVIMFTAAFAGEEEKYLRCAVRCFTDGQARPIVA
jgi:hypothetical protein